MAYELENLTLHELQPSQFYISEDKLNAVLRWFDPNDLSGFEPIPVKVLDGAVVMLDGHTRAVAALQSGLKRVPLVWEQAEWNWEMYRRCVRECRLRDVFTPDDLLPRVVPAREYWEKWDAWCDRMQAEVEQEERMQNEAIAYLSRDMALHIDLIEALRRGSARVLALSEHVCLLGHSRGEDIAQLACDDADAGEKALRELETPVRLVVTHGKPAWEAVKRVYPSFDCKAPCHQAYYPSTEPHAVPDTCTIAPYPIDRLDDVMTHYHNVNDPKYIIGRIEQGDLFAGYHNGELCGFIGFHDDGSMGMLEVFPEFRRLHIGTALEQHLINECLRRGRVPYCHIFEGNTASIRLQQSLGLLVTPDCGIAWMHAPRG